MVYVFVQHTNKVNDEAESCGKQPEKIIDISSPDNMDIYGLTNTNEIWIFSRRKSCWVKM